MRNPYVTGRWVSGNHFYGRERLIDELLHGFEDLFWVIGNRRIGKTSLLKQLEHLGQDLTSYLSLYWDIQGCRSMGDLGDALVEAVDEIAGEGLGLSLAGQEVTDVLRTLSRETAKSGRRLLLLCDEGEALMNVEEAEPRALQRLRRAIHTDANVRLVLTSSKRLGRLNELCRDWDTSPFLHGFAVRYLGGLTDIAAENLIRQTQRGAFVQASPELISEIKQVTGNHPYLIQWLCHRLWQPDHTLRSITPGDLEPDEHLTAHLRMDFDYLSDTERRILHEVCVAGKVTAAQLQATLDLPGLSTFLYGLTQLGYLWQEGEVYAIGNHFLALLDELESTQGGLISLVETAQRFFQAAGFELISKKKEETALLYRPKGKIWQQKLPERVFVEIVSGTPLDGERVRVLCQSAQLISDAKLVIFVVVDRTPTDSGWLQIGAMRAEDVQVIPIDDNVLLAGQERGRQRQVMEKHLRRFLGHEQDLYNVRHPVADRLNFFGREALANELMEHLTKGRPLALFGLRKMGKSSLLMYLRDKLPFPTALVDLQAGVDLGGLYERILTSWSRSMRVKVRNLDWSPPNLAGAPDLSSAFALATRQLLTILEDHGAPPRLCLLVDETEWIVPHNGEGVERYLAFARTLRGLVQEEEGRFSLLMAGVDPLFNRVNRLAGQQNPFYQFFREVYLPSLERGDCIQMIRNIGQQMGLVYSDEAVAFVADVSGGHPFLARQLCSLAFQQLDRPGDVSLTYLQETAIRFIREPGTSELLNENGLWGEISDPSLWPQPQVIENQAVLKSLAQIEPQPESDLVSRAQDRRACERSLDELERRSVLGKLQWALFNIRLRLFRNWIRRYQLGEE